MPEKFTILNLKKLKPACGVYTIIGPKERRYIGSSQEAAARLRQHWRDLVDGKHHCRYLQRAWIKYGGEGFTFNKIRQCTVDLLIKTEQRHIDFHLSRNHTLYNGYKVAGSPRGHKHSAAVRVKSFSKSEEYRKRQSLWMTGRTSTKETKLSISEGLARRKALGLSVGRPKGIPVSDEFRAYCKKRQTGKTHSKKTKDKMAKSRRLYYEKRLSL